MISKFLYWRLAQNLSLRQRNELTDNKPIVLGRGELRFLAISRVSGISLIRAVLEPVLRLADG